MPKKKVEEEIVESVEGRVEGMTFDEEEQRIRVAAREKALAEHGDKVIGSTKMSAVTGNILRNRARNSAVRQRTYTSGAELAGVIDAYFHGIFQEQEAGSNILPDTEGMADYLGITRATMIRWARGEDNREFVEPLQIAMNEIAAVKKQMAMDNKINGLAYVQDMQNNHEYVSNTKSGDVSINVKLKHELPPIEQLNAQMALLDSK